MTKIEPEQEERAAARSGESELLRRAIELARTGDATAARVLLVDICRKNNQSELGWLWLASVARNSKEALACTKQVLRINPANDHALAWVAKLTAPAAAVPIAPPPVPEAIHIEAPEPDQTIAPEPASSQSAPAATEAPETATPDTVQPEAQEPAHQADGLQSLAEAVATAPLETAAPETVPLETPAAEAAVENESAPLVEAAAGPELLAEPASAVEIEVATPIMEAPVSTVEEPAAAIAPKEPEVAPEVAPELVPQAVAEIVLDAATETAEPLPETTEPHALVAIPAAVESAPVSRASEPAQTLSNAQEIAAVLARPRASAATPTAKPTLPRCPICDGTLTAPEQCGTCKAMIWPADPMQYVLNRNLDRPALTQWREKLQAGPDSVANHLRLVLACCNLHDFAGARFHLNHAAMADFNASRFALESVDAFLRRATVLVVDDSATIRDVLMRLLGANELLPIPVGDSWAALNTVREQAPSAVLLDVTMPMMDGYEVCRQIRANRELKFLPVIMVSGHDGLVDKVVGKMAGASDYISKPFKPEKLLSVVQRYVFKQKKVIGNAVKIDSPRREQPWPRRS